MWITFRNPPLKKNNKLNYIHPPYRRLTAALTKTQKFNRNFVFEKLSKNTTAIAKLTRRLTAALPPPYRRLAATFIQTQTVYLKQTNYQPRRLTAALTITQKFNRNLL
jgi:hypothetical protein